MRRDPQENSTTGGSYDHAEQMSDTQAMRNGLPEGTEFPPGATGIADVPFRKPI